jgi:hypothetical protein
MNASVAPVATETPLRYSIPSLVTESAMIARRPGLALFVVVLCAACSGASESGTPCVSGKVDVCPCPGGGQGTQTCLQDGSGFGPCQYCDGAPTDVASDAPAGDDPSSHDASVKDAPAPSDAEGRPDTVPASDGTFFDDAQFVSELLAPDAAPSHACEPCGYGSLTGKVCAPNEQVFVPHALVTVNVIDCDGVPKQFQTYSDADGAYHLADLPCGVHTVVVTAGSFSTTYTAEVKVGDETDLTGIGVKLCFKAQTVTIAVLWGQWDDQQDLLADLGFETTYYNFEEEYFDDVPFDQIEAVKLLRDPELLAEYDMIFFNCGSAALKIVQKYQEIADNLQQFVLAGGSLYASDLAWAYLEAAFPDAIDFYGDDDLPDGPMAADGPQQAEGQQTVTATIADAILASHVGTDTFEAKYGAGPLIAVKYVGEGSQAHVTGTVNLYPDDLFDHTTWKGPLVVSFQPSETSGRVVYTTFHNDEQADAVMLKILYYLVFLL